MISLSPTMLAFFFFLLIRKDLIEKDQSFKIDPGKLKGRGFGQKVPRNFGEMCMFWNVVGFFSQISKVKSGEFSSSKVEGMALLLLTLLGPDFMS